MVEFFEARKPKDPAVISEIDGIVKDGGVVKGQRKMIIVPDDGTEPREYALPPQGAGALGTPGLPRGVHVNVHEGDESNWIVRWSSLRLRNRPPPQNLWVGNQ